MAGTGITLAGLLDAVRELSLPAAAKTDTQLVDDVVAWEQIRRAVDAQALAHAAVIGDRSRWELGNDGLSSKPGYGKPDGIRPTPRSQPPEQ